MNQTKNSKPISTVPEWMTDTINGGSFNHLNLETGTNGWNTTLGDVFTVRSANYFTNKHKSPGGDYLLSPVGVDWLKSTTKLEHIMSRPDNRVSHALKQAQSLGQSLNSFIFVVNVQIPWKEPYSFVHYYATEEPIPSDSLLYRFINGDDTFRNERLKCVSHVAKGPWAVKTAAGSYGAFLLSKAASCKYYRGSNYFEVDVDVSSSKILTAVLRLVLTYITRVSFAVGFLVEAQEEEELPERLIGGVRISQMELSSAFMVDDTEKKTSRMMGSAKANDDKDKV